MIVKYYLTAYPAVYGQFPQAIPQPTIATVAPAQREGKLQVSRKINQKFPLQTNPVFQTKNTKINCPK